MDWVEMDRFRFLGGTVLLLREREGELFARDEDRRLLRLRRLLSLLLLPLLRDRDSECLFRFLERFLEC